MLLRRLSFVLGAPILALSIASCSGSNSNSALPSMPGSPGGATSTAATTSVKGVPDALLRQLQAVPGAVNNPGYLPKITPRTLKNLAAWNRTVRTNATARGFSTGAASAAGGTVNLAATISLGPYAQAGNGCNALNSSASLANITALNLLSTGAAQSNILNINNASLNGTSAYTNVANINLLNGVVTADAIQAVSFSFADTTGPVGSHDFDTAGHKTSFVNLKVGGKLITNPKINTVIPVAGLGTVTLDEQQRTSVGGNSLSVTMIHVRVLASGNSFGLPVGADIYVARAVSAFFTNIPPIALTGGGLGPVAFLDASGLTGQVGPLTTAGAPCTGGSAHATAATVVLPNILTAGAATEAGSGLYQSGEGFAAGSTTLANANLLSGLVTLTAVQSQATANSAGGLTGSTSITGGLANGLIPLPTNPAPNTTIGVPGVANITLNEQVTLTTSGQSEIIVIPIDVQLLSALGPLSTGATIWVGGAAVAGTQTF